MGGCGIIKRKGEQGGIMVRNNKVYAIPSPQAGEHSTQLPRAPPIVCMEQGIAESLTPLPLKLS